MELFLINGINKNQYVNLTARVIVSLEKLKKKFWTEYLETNR